MTRFIDRNWAKWEANIIPILEASEAISEEDERRMIRQRKSALNMMTDDSCEEMKLPPEDRDFPTMPTVNQP